jgi:hypothetical protein
VDLRIYNHHGGCFRWTVENAASSLHRRLDGDKFDSDLPSAAVIEVTFGMPVRGRCRSVAKAPST